MISGGGPTSSSGRKSLDAEVNLVPFIDLLSMCICFLLMTAVWIQIGALEVKQSRGTEAAADGPFQLALRFSGATTVEFDLKKSGKPFKRVEVKEATLESLVKKLDTSLAGTLSALPGATSANVGTLVSSALVTPAKGVPYGNLIAVLDTLRKNKIVNLGVVPGEAS